MLRKSTAFLIAALLVVSTQISAQEITATPGTYDLVAGASMQFDGRPVEGRPKPESYQWTILSGSGGNLVDPGKARVTFLAPEISESTRHFTLQLTMNYADKKPSSAQIHIRVHRKAANQRRDNRSPWLYGTVGFGFGYLWGSWWDYPPIIVIPCPLPGIDILPEDLEPIAVPMEEDPGYDNWIADNPGLEGFYDTDMALSEDLVDSDLSVDTMEVDDGGAGNLEADTLQVDDSGAGSFEADSMEVEAAPLIEPVPMDNGGFNDGGFDDGGFDDGGFDDGGFDAGGFDDF